MFFGIGHFPKRFLQIILQFRKGDVGLSLYGYNSLWAYLWCWSAVHKGIHMWFSAEWWGWQERLWSFPTNFPFQSLKYLLILCKIQTKFLKSIFWKWIPSFSNSFFFKIYNEISTKFFTIFLSPIQIQVSWWLFGSDFFIALVAEGRKNWQRQPYLAL